MLAVSVINYVMEIVQVLNNGRFYTCPMKIVDDEVMFKFKNVWHKASDYISECLTTVFIEEDGKYYSRYLK